MEYAKYEALILESYDAYLFELPEALQPQGCLSSGEVEHRLYEGLLLNQLTESQYQELLQQYRYELFSLEQDPKEELRAILEVQPYFEIQKGELTYVCTRSLKGATYQVSIFLNHHQEWVAMSDRQCNTIQELVQAVQEFGLSYELLFDQRVI